MRHRPEEPIPVVAVRPGAIRGCPGIEPSATESESSPLGFDDYTLVRDWLQALDLPLVVSQRALYCLSRRAGHDPDRPWTEYSRMVVSILNSFEDPPAPAEIE
ncbi:hypothetical protein NLX62_04985 [Mycobacteriaceae bacterium Msp059]|nr:hypothetical protein [Mycobacteriaceae bacterium Msp059]